MSNTRKSDDLRSRISEMRKRAENFPKRRSDGELYSLLADTLTLCEDVEAASALDDIKAEYLASSDAAGRSRRYFEADPDVFLVVGRLVFEQEKARAACWRYTAALREAHGAGISGEALVSWLAANGGISALFLSRKVKARSAKTKTLHLNDQIEVPKDRPLTLTIQRDHRGFFDVIHFEVFKEAAE